MTIEAENYIYKKQADWSLLNDRITLPLEEQFIFGRVTDRSLHRGETKNIIIYMNGKSYDAKITNVNYSAKIRRNDTLQIAYPKNGELAQALRKCFNVSYKYLLEKRQLDKAAYHKIQLPGTAAEYVVMYTTKDENTYIWEPIFAEDMLEMGNLVKCKSEKSIEESFNYDSSDENAGLTVKTGIIKIRRLNRKIGNGLKLLYHYHCQICGKNIGEKYGAQTAEAHHIDYFIKSMDNDAQNQLIVCPNHHRIIHAVNPIFDHKKLCYIYPNGLIESLALNEHLKPLQ